MLSFQQVGFFTKELHSPLVGVFFVKELIDWGSFVGYVGIMGWKMRGRRVCASIRLLTGIVNF